MNLLALIWILFVLLVRSLVIKPDSQLAAVRLLHSVSEDLFRLHIWMHVGVVLGHLVIGVLDALNVLSALDRFDDGDIGVIPDFPQTMMRQQLMPHQFPARFGLWIASALSRVL